MGLRAGINFLEEAQIWSLWPESKQDFSIVQPLAYPLCRLDDTAIIPILLLIFELRDTGFYRTWIFFILLLAVVFFIPRTT